MCCVYIMVKNIVANKVVEHSSGMYNLFHQAFINPINTSKLFAGILMILMNIGSKYIELGLTKSQEQALRNGLGREIIIFCVVFLGTRDLVLSIIMTSAFIILSDHIFNEKSRYCIIPHHLKRLTELMDENDDGVISPQEEKQAMEILEKAKKMRKKRKQGEFLSYMDNYSSQTFEDHTFSDQFYM
jgi:hypothetical protein